MAVPGATRQTIQMQRKASALPCREESPAGIPIPPLKIFQVQAARIGDGDDVLLGDFAPYPESQAGALYLEFVLDLDSRPLSVVPLRRFVGARPR